MNVIKRSLAFIFLSILTIISLTSNVSADYGTLDSVHTEAIIKNDGTVEIEQKWIYDDTYVIDGTEHYINLKSKYYELGSDTEDEYISDYIVYRNREEMEFVEDWEFLESFEDKYNKYGVIETGKNEIELVFGVSENMSNLFTVKYTINNVIKETKDGEKYLHWSFLPTKLNPAPRRMSAEIYTEDGVEISKMYGFNYHGTIGFEDGRRDLVNVSMENTYKENDTLNIFLLLDDKQNLIQNTSKVNMTLKKKAKKILRGTTYNMKHFESEHHGVMESAKRNLVSQFFSKMNGPSIKDIVLFLFITPMIIFTVIKSYNSEESRLFRSIPEKELKKIMRDKDFYYREKPDNTEQFLLIISNVMNVLGNPRNIIEYYVSKWTSEGVFEFLENKEADFIFFKSKAVRFKVNPELLNPQSLLEEEIFDSFNHFAVDGVLDSRELMNIDIKIINKKFKEGMEESIEDLYEMGYIEEGESKKGVFQSRNLYFTDEAIDVIYQHIGMRNYLERFTLINEKTSKDIELWDYYFHLAALYGVANEFKKDLQNFPSLSESNRNTYDKFYGSSSASLLTSAVNKSISNAFSQSSGGSSGGGGAGSSGGGVGGGTR